MNNVYLCLDSQILFLKSFGFTIICFSLECSGLCFQGTWRCALWILKFKASFILGKISWIMLFKYSVSQLLQYLQLYEYLISFFLSFIWISLSPKSIFSPFLKIPFDFFHFSSLHPIPPFIIFSMGVYSFLSTCSLGWNRAGSCGPCLPTMSSASFCLWKTLAKE